MAKEKRKLTPEELYAIRANNARNAVAKRMANGTNNGGRPKGSRNKNSLPKVPAKKMTVREGDYNIFVQLAAKRNISISGLIHLIAETLKARNSKLFSQSSKPIL